MIIALEEADFLIFLINEIKDESRVMQSKLKSVIRKANFGVLMELACEVDKIMNDD